MFKKGIKQNFSSLRSKGKNWKLSEKTKKKQSDSRKSFLRKNPKALKGKNNPRYIDGLTQKERELKNKEKIAGRKKPEQCEVCGAFGRICFDHNHETGNFRGWICQRCNTVLGFVKDDSELLTKLSKFLKDNK